MGFLSSIGKAIGSVVDFVNPIAPLISAGADIIGGVMGSNNAQAATAANIGMSEADRAMQREFAQNGIRWRVEDAKAAGLHPLAATGMNPASASPSAIQIMPDNSLGNSLASAGQNIMRATQAKATSMERLQARLLETQIEGQEIENAYRASRLSRLTDPTQMPPPMPSVTPGSVRMNPAQVEVGEVGFPNRSPGRITDTQWTAQDPDGTWGIVPSQQMKDRIDDDFIGSSLWHLRNRLWRNDAPPGHYWNVMTQSYKRNIPFGKFFRGLSDSKPARRY